MPASKPVVASCIAASFVAAPASAFAAGGRTFEEVLYGFLAVSAVLLLIWAAYYFSSAHRHFMRRNADYKRVLLPILGLVALGFAASAMITGEVLLPRGLSVIRELDPRVFWRYVALQCGAGVALILLGLFYPKRRA